MRVSRQSEFTLADCTLADCTVADRTLAGFTLVELIIALAIASILLAVGVPSFTSVIQDSRIGSQYNQAVRAFFLARSEAVKASEFVVVCARSGPVAQSCGTEDDWNNGWIVFVDTGSEIDDAAVVGAGDTIISLEPPIAGRNSVRVIASLSSGEPADEVAHVRYLPGGNTDWFGGSLILCDTARGSDYSRVVNVRLTGAVQPGRPNGTERVPRDVFNSPIDCGDGE